MASPGQVAGVILAGGKASRMGGGNLSRFASFGLPVIADSLGEFAGPLAGLLAGLEWHAKNRPDISYVVSAPTDTPFFPADLVARLRAAANHQRKPVVARSESSVHPVVGLWPVETAQDLRRALNEGMRKVGA